MISKIFLLRQERANGNNERYQMTPVIEKLGSLCERIVFESRWLLLPFNFVLIISSCWFLLHFVHDGIYFLTHSIHSSSEECMVMVLGLVDTYMVANLLIMIIKGSYQIFIHKFDVPVGKRPGWLDHIDTGLLKVKTAQSIASITGVALLKEFFIANFQNRLVLHGVFLVSALVMAMIWIITHVPEPKGGEHEH